MTWACERFEKFLLGTQFHIQTDHRPLVPLLGSKELDAIPARVQRFKLRLMRFCYTISHVPGKELWTADALSRSPVEPPDNMEEETEAFVQVILQSVPASREYLIEVKKMQEDDPVCTKVREYCEKGWPTSKQQVPIEITPYFQERQPHGTRKPTRERQPPCDTKSNEEASLAPTARWPSGYLEMPATSQDVSLVARTKLSDG